MKPASVSSMLLAIMLVSWVAEIRRVWRVHLLLICRYLYYPLSSIPKGYPRASKGIFRVQYECMRGVSANGVSSVVAKDDGVALGTSSTQSGSPFPTFSLTDGPEQRSYTSASDSFIG